MLGGGLVALFFCQRLVGLVLWKLLIMLAEYVLVQYLVSLSFGLRVRSQAVVYISED